MFRRPFSSWPCLQASLYGFSIFLKTVHIMSLSVLAQAWAGFHLCNLLHNLICSHNFVFQKYTASLSLPGIIAVTH
jgi:hypothetical protein